MTTDKQEETEETKPCAARRCDELVKVSRDFCKRHWKMVTPTLKKAWAAGMRDDVLDFVEAKEKLVCQAFKYEIASDGAFWKWALLHNRQHRAVFNFAYDAWRAWNDENAGKRGKERSTKPHRTKPDLYTRFNLERARALPWLDGCHASGRSAALRDCAAAWEGWKSGKTGRPRLKRFRDPPAFTLQPVSGEATAKWIHTHVRPQAIKLPKIGWVATKEPTGKMKGRILRLAFEMRTGRWFVSCMVEREPKERWVDRQPGGVIGLDLGRLAILTLSRPYEGSDPFPYMRDDRQTIDPPRPLGKNLSKKQYVSRRWSNKASPVYLTKLHALVPGPLPVKKWKGRTKKGHFEALAKLAVKLRHVQIEDDTVTLLPRGKHVADLHPPVTVFFADGTHKERQPPSSGWKQLKGKLGELDFHIEQIRSDALNKLSTWLVAHYDVVVCEGFNVKELVKKKNRKVRSRRVRREMIDLGWGGLRLRLGYKMSPGWYGGDYLQLPADEPTKRTCHACGFVIAQEKMPRSSDFHCPQCNNRTSVQRNTALYCESFGLRPGPTGGQPGSNDAGDPEKAQSSASESPRRPAGRLGSQDSPSGEKERGSLQSSERPPGGDGRPGANFLRVDRKRPRSVADDGEATPAAVVAPLQRRRRRRKGQ